MNLITEGMFLCAGLSTRMRPLTNEIPKVLLPFIDKTVFDWMSTYFLSQQIKRIAINTHHGAKHIDAFLEAGDFDQEFHTFFEEDILGSGGGVKNMQAFVTQDHFFVINCDIMTDLDLQKMFTFHLEKKALATLALFPNPGDKYTKIYTHDDHKISSILSPNTSNTYAGMFGGVSIFSKDIFMEMPLENKFCLIQNLVEPLCKKGAPIFGYPCQSRWHDTGEMDLYKASQETLTQNPLSWMK